MAAAEAPLSTVVRHTIDKMTAESRRPDQDSITWDYVHLLSVVTQLDIDGHRVPVLEALEKAAALYGVEVQP